MDIVRRLVWFAIVATAAFFAIFVVLGDFATSAWSNNTTAIRDVVSPGTHTLSGMVVLPLSCDELSVTTNQASPTLYQILFQTWQDPSIQCESSPTPRLFQTIVFAPSAGVSFAASLDGKSLPITVLPEQATTSAL